MGRRQAPGRLTPLCGSLHVRKRQAQGTAAHQMSLFLPGDPKGTIDATPGSEQAPVLNRGLSFRLGSHLLACCGTGTAHRLCRFITSLRAPESCMHSRQRYSGVQRYINKPITKLAPRRRLFAWQLYTQK